MRCLVIALLVAGCAGPSAAPRVIEPAPVVVAPASRPSPPAATTPAPAPREPEGPDVRVRGTRSGRALLVEVVGLARDREPGSDFEQADAWDVIAEAAGVELQRVVNGSTRITRLETGRGRWDVTVELEVAFALPEDDLGRAAEIVVTPPGAAPSRFTVD